MKNMLSDLVFTSFLLECFSCNKKVKSKNVEEKISMDIDDVMNDINAWLVAEENDSTWMIISMSQLVKQIMKMTDMK